MEECVGLLRAKKQARSDSFPKPVMYFLARQLRNHLQLAPVAELPILEVLSGIHIIADLTLGLGKVVHDYLR